MAGYRVKWTHAKIFNSWLFMVSARKKIPTPLTQDIHSALELKWPFHCELWRSLCPIGGHWYFGANCLDLNGKRKGKKDWRKGHESGVLTLPVPYPTCWKQAWTKFSGKRFRMRSKKASTLDTSSFFFPCPRLAFSLGFPGWMTRTRTTPRIAAMMVVDM